MTKIAQVEDRGAAVAWSPVGDYADVIALGAKDSGTIGFDDRGGELELFDLGITSSTTNSTPTVIGSIKTTSRFSSIAWTTGTSTISDRFQMGLIAGGMDDGTINIWDSSSILHSSSSSDAPSSSKALLSSISRDSGAITALSFNPHPNSSNLLASGGRDGEILITSLDNPSQPTVTVPSADHSLQSAEITHTTWNSEVAHIVASSSGSGSAVVWDLRQNKPWCELRESSGGSVSDIAWNPGQGMHLITASSDDRSPVLKLWDLRASMSMPLATLEGHLSGVLGLAWCPHDTSLLVSCGKDNRTLLWDVNTLKSIAEIPNEERGGGVGEAGGGGGSTADPSVTTASGLYGAGIAGGLSSSQQKRYDVQWSPLRRGVLSTCSFDRKVQAHSVISAATKCGRPPQWMKPASGVSCGIGGSVVSFASTHKVVTLTNHVELPELKEVSIAFEAAVAEGDYIGFSLSRAEAAAKAGSHYESQVWGFMQVMFEENARSQLLSYLGFDPARINELAMGFNNDNGGGGDDGVNGVSNDVSNLSIDGTSTILKKDVTPPMSADAENAVNQALLVGNFEAAVQCCFRSGNLADALVLASCGGAELWSKAQAQYFESEIRKRPFLSIVNAVLHNKLADFVAGSKPSQWNETLAVLCTYATSEEFPSLCEALGDYLENSGDSPSASLCYMCALNLEKAAKFWVTQLEAANAKANGADYLALHAFAEKAAIFMKISDQSSGVPEIVAEPLYQYAKALSCQGLFPTAAKYCRSNSQKCKELADLLYRSKFSHECVQALGKTPEYPFNYCNIGVAPKSHQQSVRNGYEANNSRATQPITNGLNNGTKAYSNQKAKSHTTNSSHKPLQQPSVNPTTQVTTPQLPEGWIALQDPASGKPYYANQTTGETTWDMPVAVQPAAPSVATTNKPSFDDVSSPAKVLGSKYGDGFVSSHSHPELGSQYGNIGTSDPYSDSTRPGQADLRKVEKPPVSGTFNPNNPPEVSAEYKPLVDDLIAWVTALAPAQMSSSERKQLSEIEKGAAVFSKRLARNEISPEIAAKLGQMLSAMGARNYAAAGGIHTELVNSVWKEHKDWLKGMKLLIQLAAKIL